MCDIVQGFVREGVEKGKTDIIRNLIESKAGSIEQIAAWVKLPLEEVKKIAQKMPVMN